jgi:hypothetical protein
MASISQYVYTQIFYYTSGLSVICSGLDSVDWPQPNCLCCYWYQGKTLYAAVTCSVHGIVYIQYGPWTVFNPFGTDHFASLFTGPSQPGLILYNVFAVEQKAWYSHRATRMKWWASMVRSPYHTYWGQLVVAQHLIFNFAVSSFQYILKGIFKILFGHKIICTLQEIKKRRFLWPGILPICQNFSLFKISESS